MSSRSRCSLGDAQPGVERQQGKHRSLGAGWAAMARSHRRVGAATLTASKVKIRPG